MKKGRQARKEKKLRKNRKDGIGRESRIEELAKNGGEESRIEEFAK